MTGVCKTLGYCLGVREGKGKGMVFPTLHIPLPLLGVSGVSGIVKEWLNSLLGKYSTHDSAKSDVECKPTTDRPVTNGAPMWFMTPQLQLSTPGCT